MALPLKSFRVTPQEAKDMETIITLDYTSTPSEAIRRALHFYAEELRRKDCEKNKRHTR